MRKDPDFLFISETNVNVNSSRSSSIQRSKTTADKSCLVIFRKFSYTFIEKNDGQKTNRKKDRPTKSKKTDRLKDSEIDR